MEINRAKWSAQDWRGASSDAREILTAVIDWHLVPARWQDVRGTIAQMESAIAAVNATAMWDAIGQMERLGPVRVSTRLGDKVKEPVPDDVRERVNELIVALVREEHDQPPG